MTNLLAAKATNGRWHRVSLTSLQAKHGYRAACDHRMSLRPPIHSAANVDQLNETVCRRQGCWPR